MREEVDVGVFVLHDEVSEVLPVLSVEPVFETLIREVSSARGTR